MNSLKKSLSSKLDTSNKPNPFMPGVSIILDPNSRSCISENVVVC